MPGMRIRCSLQSVDFPTADTLGNAPGILGRGTCELRRVDGGGCARWLCVIPTRSLESKTSKSDGSCALVD